MLRKLKLLCGLVLLTMFFVPCLAQEQSSPAIYIIFDASGSMWQKLADGSLKIEAAKKVLQEFVHGNFEGYELAFRAYGHRKKGDCRDSELIVPFGASERSTKKLMTFMAEVNPTGKTPIHYSLLQALGDLGDRKGEIILISDGEETCDTDPCELVKAWRDKHVKVRVHVVGLGLDEKSKTAMQCISEAAGTEYHDAQTANDLAGSLAKIQKKTAAAAFIVRGLDSNGKRMRSFGTLSRTGQKLYDVTSNGRNLVEPGDYQLEFGVRTKNGNLYKPVSKMIHVAKTGETQIKLQVPKPPTVKTKFIENGKETPGRTQIYAYQNGLEVFTFRWKDEVFIDEGAYEFRAKPNQFNDLSVTESFSTGDHKEVLFKMQYSVKVYFKMVASGSGILFRQNYELWQEGERKHKVHRSNGARVLPGTYDLHMPNVLTPYIKTGIVITENDKQNFEITVPAGHVTIIYQKADGIRDKDERCFMSSLNPGASKNSKYTNTGQKVPLVPGKYKVIGYSYKGDYDPVEFEVKEGEDIEVVLRAK